MKVELIIPVEKLRGRLQKDGYYFRMYRDQQIVQRQGRQHGSYLSRDMGNAQGINPASRTNNNQQQN